MAKIQIKSEKLTSFGGIFPIMEKFDAKMTYKKFTGYSPGIATVGDVIVGIMSLRYAPSFFINHFYNFGITIIESCHTFYFLVNTEKRTIYRH